MNDVGGSDSGTGLRAVKSSRTSDANFEYDDSEWDVGIGNLIIDLDADIEKNNEANRSSNSSASNTLNTSPVSSSNSTTGNNTNRSNSPGNSSLPSGSPAAASQMHIPHPSATSSGTSSNNSNANNNSSSTGKGKSSNSSLASGGKATTSAVVNSSDLPSSMEHSAIVDKGLKMKIKRTKAGTKSGADAKHEIVKNDLVTAASTALGSNSNNSNSSSGSIKTGSLGSTDSISSKSAHSSSSHKDKDKIKDSSSMMMIDAERDAAGTASSNHSGSGSITTNNGIKDGGANNDQGNKGKAQRKGSNHKKVKSGNGNSSSKKDERITNASVNSSDTKGNSSASATTGNHTKDGKDFFSTTVSLNVPTIVPNANSSFTKTTLKVPTATASSIPLSTIPIHPSLETSSASRGHGHSSSNVSPWTAGSPSKPVEKGTTSAVSLGLNVEKGQGNSSPSYGKKAKTFTPTDKGASNQEDGLAISLVNSSYRSASISDLGNSTGPLSSVNHQGVPISQSSTFLNCKPSRTLQQPVLTQDVGVGTSVGTITDPDCLGPCEPGTSVTLEGIVWHETEGGVLVVNVTWRGKTYVGTLLDFTKTDWAPPRFCDSPTSDLEMRNPKIRGKRGRGQAATPVNEVQPDARAGNAKLRNGAKGRRGSASNTAFVAPASPVKGEQWPKRKTRGSENEGQDDPPAPKNAKRQKITKEERKERKSSSPAPGSDADKSSAPTSPVLIECPEPNCSKKYKHINGLRYHQNHAHCTNFATEDSDSNASTTSTQLATPTDNVTVNERPSSEPMEVDKICDLEVGDVTSATVDESSSKRSIAPINNGIVGIKIDEKIFDLNTDTEINDKDNSSERVEPPTLLSGKSLNKNVKNQKEISTADKDGEAKPIVDSPLNKDPLTSSTIPTRPPILTVPVPYPSLPNRPIIHGHPMNIPRTESMHSSRDQDTIVMKTTSSSIGNTTNVPLIPAKGIPWQPHAHTSQNHTGPMITTNTLPQQSLSVPLNIPLSGGNDKVSNKEKEKNSSNESQGKKSKHKKKNKDKEKDGKYKSGESSKGRSGSDGSRPPGNMFGSNIPMSETADGRFSEAADDLRMGKRDDIMHKKNDGSHGSGGNSGDNRDDPQSPAYSDISDANDSGDTELNVNVAVVKDGCKNIVVPPEIKKDSPAAVAGGHSISSFYPTSFYSPYLDSNHSNKLGDTKPSPPEEQPDKSKTVKPIPQPHGQGQPPVNTLPPSSTQINPEDPGRSPKMDFHHPKYHHLPQQHFFHYPYSNYHFDQGPYNNLMPENAFNSGRAFAPVEEREKERELIGEHGKGKVPEKDGIPMGMTIKQEPGERPQKESRPLSMGKSNIEEKQVEVKSEFGSEYPDPKPVPHFIGTPCSKHSKDPKRDEMNKNDQSRTGASCDKPKPKDGSSSLDSEKDLKEREREREKIEGSKPTMETQGPPPPPTAGPYAFMPQPYLQGNPFGLHFDPGHPLYRQVLVPNYGGPPYMHPGSMPRFQPPPGATSLPEDLSRPSTSAAGPPPKALDLLQHHAQYYQVHKIHELSERALKSPSPQVAQRDREAPPGPLSSNNTPASPVGLNVPNVVPNSRNSGNNSVSASGSVPKPADLSKDSKMGPSGPLNESSRSPPTQHHVHSHTHHHTHVGIGYPIIPAFPAPHSPHYGVLPTTSPTVSVIPPFPSQKPN